MTKDELVNKISKLQNELDLLKSQNILINEGSDNAYTFQDLIDISRLNELLHDFYELTGLGVGIKDTNDNILVAVGWQRICTEFHRKHPETLDNCIESDQFIEKKVDTKDFVSYKCKNGLWDIAYPVKIGDIHMATIYFGQFFYEEEKPDRNFFKKQAAKYGFDEEAYLKALDEVITLPRDKVNKLLSFYKNLIDSIIRPAHSTMILLNEQKKKKRAIERELSHNERLLNNIIDNLPFGLQIFDKEGFSTRINKKQRELLGIKRDESGIKEFNILTDPHSIKYGASELFKRVYEKKIVQSREFEYDFNVIESEYNAKKDIKYLKETVFPILNDEDKVSYVIALVEDITASKKVEKTLRENEQRLKSIFDNAISGIAFSDNKGRIIMMNRAFEDILQYHHDEIINKHFSVFTHNSDLEDEISMLRETLQHGNTFVRFEKRYIRKDKQIVWVDISISVILDANDKPEFYVAVINDITSKKNAEFQLEQALRFNQGINETSPVAIFSMNKEGYIEFVNNRAVEIMGIKKAGIIGLRYNDSSWDITDFNGNPVADKDLPFSLVKREQKNINDMQHTIRHPDGQRIYLSVNASPRFGDDGKFDGIIATMEDITKKVHSENELKESFIFRSAIIKNAAEGLCVCYNCNDYPYVKFTVWNDQMKELTGYTMDEINELGWYQTLYPDPDVRQQAMERMQKMREGEDILAEEWTVQTKYNKPKTISISTSIIKIENDRKYVMALMTDISEKKEYQDMIEQKNRELSDLNAAKDKFFSILAHDLRNPVGTILNYTELIKESLEEKEYDKTFELADTLENSAKLSFDLLVNLLDWTRAQTGKMEFEPQQINLTTIINENIELMEIQAQKKSVKITNNISIPLYTSADRNMITTVIRNLLSNAIKYSYQNGEVIFNGEIIKKEVQVSVSDKGTGMDHQTKENIFHIESGHSREGTHKEKGTGLGLLLCKEFIDFHKGTIWADSEPDKGSTFYFSIPVVEENNLKEPSESGNNIEKPDLLKILIAEDENINFLLLKEYLKKGNYEIIRAKNGKEAVEKVKKNEDIKLILMDINMPIMDGVDATKLIRKINKEIPIIAQTAYFHSDEIKSLFNVYLTKPLDKRSLLKTIDKLI